jgi:lysophospholipase L1-like esterase
VTRAALATVLTLACAACGSVPSLPRLAPGDVLLAFGDSLTYGTGATPAEAYPTVLATLIGHEVVPAGVPGERTDAGLRRLPAALERNRPKILLLCLGGNDMLQRVEPATTEANLRAMVELAQGRGVAVVLIGVPKPPLFGRSVAYFDAIASDFKIPIENAILGDLLYDGRMKSDTIHPNASGYRRMAEAVADLLRRAGAICCETSGAGIAQQRHHDHAVGRRGQVQRRLVVEPWGAAAADREIGAGIGEQSDDGIAPVHHGEHQRREMELRSVVEVRAVRDEPAHRLDVPVASDVHQRRLTVRVIRIDVGPGSDERVEGVGVAGAHCRPPRLAEIGRGRAHGSGTLTLRR